MLNARFISLLMPVVAGGFFLWYKKRNGAKDAEEETNGGGGDVVGGSGGGGGGGGGKEGGKEVDADHVALVEREATSFRVNNNSDDAEVDLGSSLVRLSVSRNDDDDDGHPLPEMPSTPPPLNDNKYNKVNDSDGEVLEESDLSDVEFHQRRVLDWAEERVSISEADLGADLESLLQSSANLVDESPSTRRLRMRRSPRQHQQEASRVSSSGDEGASSTTSGSSSWRHNSGEEASSSTWRLGGGESTASGVTPTKSRGASPWSSLQNTPDPKRSPRNRRLKRTGAYGEDTSSSLQSTLNASCGGDNNNDDASTTPMRACPVISCIPSPAPSSAAASSAAADMTSSSSPQKRNGSDSENWRDNMGKWEEFSTRSSHNSPTDRCSEISTDSGRGGSEGIPAISIASSGDIVIYEFEFPSELCGRLIGKGGNNLHQMMTESNTRMALRKQPFTEDHQIVSVTGRQEDVQSVLQSVRHKFPKHRHPEVDLRPVQMPLPQDLLVPDILPLSLPEGGPVDVVTSAVISTAHVFLQMPNHHTFPNLPRLDACMLACYSQPGAPPLPSPIEPGVICAAPQSGGWYRAQIVELLPAATAEEGMSVDGAEDANLPLVDASLRFVDYGGYARIPLAQLRQIRSDFIGLPFQAVECYLAHLAPPIDGQFEFPIEGAFYLEQLVKSSALQAEVVAYAEDGIPCVYLFKNDPQQQHQQQFENEQSKERLSINEAIVAHGDAKWIQLNLYNGEEDEAMVLQQQQLQDYSGVMTSSSTFTEDDAALAVVFTPSLKSNITAETDIQNPQKLLLQQQQQQHAETESHSLTDICSSSSNSSSSSSGSSSGSSSSNSQCEEQVKDLSGSLITVS